MTSSSSDITVGQAYSISRTSIMEWNRVTQPLLIWWKVLPTYRPRELQYDSENRVTQVKLQGPEKTQKMSVKSQG